MRKAAARLRKAKAPSVQPQILLSHLSHFMHATLLFSLQNCPVGFERPPICASLRCVIQFNQANVGSSKRPWAQKPNMIKSHVRRNFDSWMNALHVGCLSWVLPAAAAAVVVHIIYSLSSWQRCRPWILRLRQHRGVWWEDSWGLEEQWGPQGKNESTCAVRDDLASWERGSVCDWCFIQGVRRARAPGLLFRATSCVYVCAHTTWK